MKRIIFPLTILLATGSFGIGIRVLHAESDEPVSMDQRLQHPWLSSRSLEFRDFDKYFGINLAAPRATAHLVMQVSPGRIERLKQKGFPIEAQIGDIVTTTVPLDQLADLADDTDIIAVEPVKRYLPHLNQSIADIRADQLRTRFTAGEFEGLTGKQVIIAVIDSGIDWRHADFHKPDGTTRIKYLWDPSDPSYFLSAGAIGSAPPAGGRGTVYNEAQINAALIGLGSVNSSDECGHGTHVTGIAAGNGNAGGGGTLPGTYVGVAPQADIIVVRVFDEKCLFLAEDVSLVQAMSFVDQQAGKLGEPYVINLSLGTQIGGHDGYDLEELAIDDLTGTGKYGKAVVVSAGNEGNTPVHVGGTFGAPGSSTNTVTINVAQNQPKQALYDFWFSPQDLFTVTLEGGGQPPVDITNQVSFGPFLRSKRLLFVTDRAPFFSIRITGQTVNDGHFDGWLEGNASFMSNIENSKLVGIPGTSRRAITVGAHTTKTQWTDKSGTTWTLIVGTIGAPAAFTSPGPTRDGRLKPELAAPGQVIASSLSSTHSSAVFLDFQILPGEQHAIAQGTSMSAPHVSGAIGLLLEQFPGLNADLAKALITQSARNDPYTQPSPNPVTGFGKLDAAAALRLEGPRVFLSVNQNQLLARENLIVDYVLQSGAQENSPVSIDGWVAVEFPDGRFAFLNQDDTGFSFQEAPYRPDLEVINLTGQLISITVPEDIPPGKYTFYAVGTIPNTNPFDSGNWVTNLASQTVEVLP